MTNHLDLAVSTLHHEVMKNARFVNKSDAGTSILYIPLRNHAAVIKLLGKEKMVKKKKMYTIITTGAVTET